MWECLGALQSRLRLPIEVGCPSICPQFTPLIRNKGPWRGQETLIYLCWVVLFIKPGMLNDLYCIRTPPLPPSPCHRSLTTKQPTPGSRNRFLAGLRWPFVTCLRAAWGVIFDSSIALCRICRNWSWYCSTLGEPWESKSWIAYWPKHGWLLPRGKWDGMVVSQLVFRLMVTSLFSPESFQQHSISQILRKTAGLEFFFKKNCLLNPSKSQLAALVVEEQNTWPTGSQKGFHPGVGVASIQSLAGRYFIFFPQ